MEDDMADGEAEDGEAERRLDELRERVNLAFMRERMKTAARRQALLRWICLLVATIVFVVTLFVRDFLHYPKEASILGLLCAAVVFCIALLIVRAIRRFWLR
jgi:hypothetical protein